MIRRLGTVLAGGLLLTIVGLTTLPITASADSGAAAPSQAQTYVCNVGDSDSTATVQTTDIDGASAVMPSFLGMQLTNCRLAS